MMLLCELVGICAATSLFVLRYGTSRPWWRTHAGRALVTATLGMALLSGAFIAQASGVVIPDGTFESIAAVILIGAVLTLLLLIADDWRRFNARR